jgi:hypothetical protein
MQLLANGNLADNLAPEKLTKSFQLSQLGKAIKIAIIAIGVLGLLSSAWMFMQGLENQSAYKQAVQDTTLQQYRYDEVAKNFPATPIGANDLKIAVDLDQTIANYPKSPRRMMQVLSAALEKSGQDSLDNIQLDRLRWILSNDVNIRDDDKFIPMPSTSPTNTTKANAAVTSFVNPAALNEIGFMTAEISGFTGDYRAALNSVNRYVANLKADPRVASVDVMQEPVNVSSFADLQGSTTDELSTQKLPAFFKLRVILKPAVQLLPAATEVNQP